MKLQEKDAQKMTELTAEELDAIIAPGLTLQNHNETFVIGTTDLVAEELDAIIAPGIGFGNHNETFLRYVIGD